VLDKKIDPDRDRWEFQAVQERALARVADSGNCKVFQVFNVALGGTLKLDIKDTICRSKSKGMFSRCAMRVGRRIVFPK